LTRSVNGGYPQYHTSADDLSLITADQLGQSLEVCKRIVEVLESNRHYVNLSPKGEPRLGKRGLYGAVGGLSPADRERAMLWVLNQSDGTASVLDIAKRSGIAWPVISAAADELAKASLLRVADSSGPATAAAAPPNTQARSKARARPKARAQPGRLAASRPGRRKRPEHKSSGRRK
jgi:hypothetical protein